MKIAYFGYDFFYQCLESLIQDKHEIVKIFTFETDQKYDFNTNIKRIASEHDIPLQDVKPSKDDIQKLIDDGVEMILSCAYLYKIPVLEGRDYYSLNLHPSLLPKVRGIWPLPVILLKESDAAGLTLHKHTNGFDEGDIVLQQAIPLTAQDDLESYSAKCQMLAPKMLKDCLSNIEEYWENAISQDEKGEGSYYSLPPDDWRTFNFEVMTVDEIDRIGKAFGRFECIFYMDGQKYWMDCYSVWKDDHDLKVDELVVKTNKELVFAVQDGFVCIKNYYKDER